MIRTLAQTQPSALAQPMEALRQREWLRGALDRIALLVPEAAVQAPRDPLAYALAFVERYHRDVPQVEHEWEFLSFALAQAWRCADYSAVVRLVDDLAYIVGRLSDRAAAEEVLRRGIAASRYTQDAHHLALFLSRLGGLLFSYGQRESGRRLWRAGQRFARRAGVRSGLWEPLATFAQISDMLGSYEAVRDFAECLMRAHRLTDPETLAVAVFLWGFRARGHGQLEEAHEHFSRALRLLSLRAVPTPSPARQIFTLTVQAELARVRGDFPRARAYTETVFSLARVYSDHYTVAALLLDQGIFTYYLGQLADCRATIAHLRAIAPQLDCLPIYQDGYRFLERQLSEAARMSDASSTSQPSVSSLTPLTAALPEPLSARELDVLRLVADGLANREIAARLVITPSTVKKHLEHIYSKLGTPSRTAAIARARALHLLP